MEKEEHINGYHFYTKILGNYFKWYYKPTIINSEVIPKEGPIIVCGNHIHLFDQCLPIISTKRMLHYMAKKEYFDGKFAWFFIANGCISVDRENHGGNSKDIAESLLEKGYALGIYPEGTRNSLVCKEEKFSEVYEFIKDKITKEDYKKLCEDNLVLVSQTNLLLKLYKNKKISQDELKSYLLDVDNSLLNLVDKKIITKEEYNDNILLPLKFGVVSMAQKTHATIVPYAISGKYQKKDNHLNVRFGTPFKVPEDMDLEEANKKLKDEITNLKLEGIKEIKEGII